MNKKSTTKDKKFTTLTLILFGVILTANLGTLVWAADTGQSTAADRAGCQLGKVLCNIARLIFMIAGAVAALVMIMAGLRWVTSADDPGARNAAKTTIISAIIGLVIIMVAVYIVAMVVGNMLGSAGNVIDVTRWLEGCDYECGGGSTGGNNNPSTGR